MISTHGGYGPRWAARGRELFYRTSNKMMLVTIETSPSFHASVPILLFEADFEASYDVLPDGKRFVMMKQSDHAPTQLRFEQDWFEELRRQVPRNKN